MHAVSGSANFANYYDGSEVLLFPIPQLLLNTTKKKKGCEAIIIILSPAFRQRDSAINSRKPFFSFLEEKSVTQIEYIFIRFSA